MVKSVSGDGGASGEEGFQEALVGERAKEPVSQSVSQSRNTACRLMAGTVPGSDSGAQAAAWEP